MRKVCSLLAVAAMPALLLTGCGTVQPDTAGFTNAMSQYAELTGEAPTDARSDSSADLLQSGKEICASLDEGRLTSASSSDVVLASTAGRADTASRTAFQWLELTTAAEYLCPQHMDLAKRIASTMPGFDGS